MLETTSELEKENLELKEKNRCQRAYNFDLQRENQRLQNQNDKLLKIIENLSSGKFLNLEFGD